MHYEIFGLRGSDNWRNTTDAHNLLLLYEHLSILYILKNTKAKNKSQNVVVELGRETMC